LGNSLSFSASTLVESDEASMPVLSQPNCVEKQWTPQQTPRYLQPDGNAIYFSLFVITLLTVLIHVPCPLIAAIGHA
jgi:hypothetical protein